MAKRFFSGRLGFAPNVLSPKGAATKNPATEETMKRLEEAAKNAPEDDVLSPKTRRDLSRTRRRLSVEATTNLVEGVEELAIGEGAAAVSAAAPADGEARGGGGAGGGAVGRLGPDDPLSPTSEHAVGGAPGQSALADREDDSAAAGGATEDDGSGGGGGFVVTSYAGHSKKGYAPYNPRKKNQDALIMIEDAVTQSLCLGVLDGHGELGDSVAQFFKREIENTLFQHPSFGDDIELAITETVARAENRLHNNTSIDTDFSGTTMVLSVVRGSRIVVGNIGDSRITLATHDAEVGRDTAAAISEDHKPDSPGEKERILAAGGRVFAVEYDDGIEGPPRVWLGHMDVPGLAMSRSLGDVVAHSAGVTSTPEFFTRDLDPTKDSMLILASDGLWEFVSDQDAVDIAASWAEPSTAVNQLIREANDRWMREEQVVDDTTVCVAFLRGKH